MSLGSALIFMVKTLYGLQGKSSQMFVCLKFFLLLAFRKVKKMLVRIINFMEKLKGYFLI
jgi:hypothetical protein